MENLGLKMFGGIYRERSVLLTGHTGFKGSWLALWLKDMGARVTGVSLPPETAPNHWDMLGLDIHDRRADIRDVPALIRAFNESSPEIVFHLAAQPLVRRSYRDPLETWSTNVLGTANVLEACRATPSVRAVVVVTSDKCYENMEWPWGYRENDRIGGHDPYSASKAAAEIVAASYRSAFFARDSRLLLATVRAGNVIGGGDWSEDRLIPDLIRAVQRGGELDVRSPASVRPWQHVLESLSGYLLLGKMLLEGRCEYAAPWNFGPDSADTCSVSQVLGSLAGYWPKLAWRDVSQVCEQLHETQLLYLDSSKARGQLNWRPVWGLQGALAATATWYRVWLEEGRVISAEQLHEYVRRAAHCGCLWAAP